MSEPSRKLSTEEVNALMEGLRSGDLSTSTSLKDSSAVKHYPALGEATISGIMVVADDKTGLATKVEPIILGGILENRV